MFNIAGFAKEGAREDNVYGLKGEWEEAEDPFDQDEKTADTSHDRDHKDVKHSRDYLASGLDKEVIPNQWSYGTQEIQRKGDKNTFYCEVRKSNFPFIRDGIMLYDVFVLFRSVTLS